MKQIKKALSFDDVLLKPRYWDGGSRKSVDLTTTISGLKLSLPIISANMPSVTGLDMCLVMSDVGGLGIVDRMIDLPSQLDTIFKFKQAKPNGLIGASIGVGSRWKEDALTLMDTGADIICLDVAHANQSLAIDVIEQFIAEWKFPFIAGNFSEYPNIGDISSLSLKLGVGGGSVCTTRIQTGCGLPTFQTILDTIHQQHNRHPRKSIQFIADGGIKNSGDIVKSLAAGANAVMIGSLLAGTKEAPGDILKDDKTGNRYKIYRGNASFGSKSASNLKTEFIEGAETLVKYKGSALKVLEQLEDGIRSGLTYCGAADIAQLQECAEFVEITHSGMNESKPHALF